MCLWSSTPLRHRFRGTDAPENGITYAGVLRDAVGDDGVERLVAAIETKDEASRMIDALMALAPVERSTVARPVGEQPEGVR